MLGGQVRGLLELLALPGAGVLRALQVHPALAGQVAHRVQEGLAQVALHEGDGVTAPGAST